MAAEGTLLVGAGGVLQGVEAAGRAGRLTQSFLFRTCVYFEFPEFFPHSQHKVLVDSGAAGNFIDSSFAIR